MSRRDTQDQHISLEVVWCPACRADCSVEVIALAGDPEPVAICLGCGLGVQTWWLPAAGHETDGAGRDVRAS